MIVPALLAATACEQQTESQEPNDEEPKTQWIDPNTIQAGPTIHGTLPNELVERIKVVHGTFAEVDGTPLEKWIADFKRDANPEGNVKIWEDMKVAYDKYCDGRGLPLQTRKEVFKVVLFRSMASAEDVLARIGLSTLSKEDASEIMEGYPSAPKPIDVIEGNP